MLRLFLPFLIVAGLALQTSVFVHAAETPDSEEVKEEVKDEPEDSEEVAEDEEGEEVAEPLFDRQASRLEKKPKGRHQPWRLLRSIQEQQDRVVSGEKNAANAYRILLVQSANWMRLLDDSAWQYERNLDAVAVYLLIGGDVQLGYKALQKTQLDWSHKLLLEAAVAYSERDIAKSYRLMSRIDHMSLPPSMAGQVALAKAMVFSSADLATAANYLQQARKLAPGTLIEEAALRRAIRVAAEMNLMENLRYFTRTYLHRFRSSHYFTDFLRNTSYGLVKLSNTTGNDVIPDFQYILDNITPEQQVQVTQYIARKAVVTGRFQLAEWAAGFAFGRVKEGSKFHTRLKLYSAAGQVIDPVNTEGTAAFIEGLEVKHLGTGDRKLFEAVNILSQQILREPKIMNSFEENTGELLDEMMKSDSEEVVMDEMNKQEVDKVVLVRSARLKKLTDEIESITGRKMQ